MNVGDPSFQLSGVNPHNVNLEVGRNSHQVQEVHVAAAFVTALNDLFQHNEDLRNHISKGRAKFTYKLIHRGWIYTFLRLILQRTNWFVRENGIQNRLESLISQDHARINTLRGGLERAKEDREISPDIAKELLKLEEQIRTIEVNPLSVNEEQVRRISGAIAPLLADLNPQAAGIGETALGFEGCDSELDEIDNRINLED